MRLLRGTDWIFKYNLVSSQHLKGWLSHSPSLPSWRHSKATVTMSNSSAQSHNRNCDCRASKDDCDRILSDSSLLVTRTRILCDLF